MGVRRYRLKFSVVPEDGSYSTQVKEFTSLRSAGEFIQKMPSTHQFLDIRAVDISPLQEQEKFAFAKFTAGKVCLK